MLNSIIIYVRKAVNSQSHILYYYKIKENYLIYNTNENRSNDGNNRLNRGKYNILKFKFYFIFLYYY